MPWLFLAVVEIKKCLIEVEKQTRVNYFSTEFRETGQFWSGYISPVGVPCRVTLLSSASRCSLSEAVAWCSQASMSPKYLRERIM